jgi:hypothetical protein
MYTCPCSAREESQDGPRDLSVFGLLVIVAIGLCNDRPECESEHYGAHDKVWPMNRRGLF